MFMPLWASLALAPLSLAPSSEIATFVNYEPVKLVRCAEGSGTAFRISDGRLLSVAHVTTMTGCKIDGKLITVLHSDGGQDFSILAPMGKGSGFKVNCGGYKTGEFAYAVGYAKGIPIQRMQTLSATEIRIDLNRLGPAFSILTGARFIPGMSGGISMNRAGEAVGMVNAYSPWFPISFSRPLSDTILCK